MNQRVFQQEGAKVGNRTPFAERTLHQSGMDVIRDGERDTAGCSLCCISAANEMGHVCGFIGVPKAEPA